MGVSSSMACCHTVGGICCGEDEDKMKFCPEEELRALAWFGVGQPGFIFPECRTDEHGVPALLAKPSFAICVSGGGFRATCCAIGWIRALWHLGVVQRAQYLCSNSGGSWFNAAFSYQEMVSVNEFLGTYTVPDRLDRKTAKELEEGSYAQAVANANGIVSELADDIVCNKTCGSNDEDGLRLKPWERAVATAFLSPFGIGDADQAFALAGRGADRAEQCGVSNVCTACRNPDMPYPILVGTMMLEDDPFIFRSYEFTPQYTGMPAALQSTPQMQVGGVLVESYASSSSPPTAALNKLRDNCQEVQLEVKWVVPLAEAVGISSQYLAENYASDKNIDHKFSWMEYWNAQSIGDAVQFADGGGTDNMAVLPAVRRGVRKLIVCGAVGSPPDKDWAGYNNDISGLFGATPDGHGPAVKAGIIDASDWNRLIQVFEPRAWDELLAQVLKQHSAGQPLRARVKSRVLPNSFQGVKGNYEIDMLWLFNGGAESWRRYIPEETNSLLRNRYKNFPYVTVNLMDYPPVLVNCLSNLASWCVFEGKQDIINFLGRP